MALKIKCPCGAKIGAKNEHIGRLIGCPKCGRKLKVAAPTIASDPIATSAVVPAIPVQPIRPVASPQRQARPIQQRPAQPQSPYRQPQYQPQPVRQNSFANSGTPQGQPISQNSTPDKTIMIGGMIAIVLVALVVVSLAGMYMLQRTSSNNSQNVASSGTNQQTAPRYSNPAPPPNESREMQASANTTQTDSGNRVRTNPPAKTDPRSNNSPTETDRAVMNLKDLIVAVEPSVVRIDVTSSEGSGIGSGVFIRSDGIVLTNYHVVQGARRVTVTINDKGKTATTAKGFLFADPELDLAVIKVDETKIPVKVIDLSEYVPRKGEDVAAFGCPQGFDFTATQGVVSSVRTGKEVQKALSGMIGLDIYSMLGYSPNTNWIQMTAAISGGNSGGPLVNMRGELIGINTWTNPQGQNMNFASTIDEIRTAIASSESKRVQDWSRLPTKRIRFTFEGREYELGPGGGITDSGGNSPSNGRGGIRVPVTRPGDSRSGSSRGSSRSRPPTNRPTFPRF